MQTKRYIRFAPFALALLLTLLLYASGCTNYDDLRYKQEDAERQAQMEAKAALEDALGAAYDFMGAADNVPIATLLDNLPDAINSAMVMECISAEDAAAVAAFVEEFNDEDIRAQLGDATLINLPDVSLTLPDSLTDIAAILTASRECNLSKSAGEFPISEGGVDVGKSCPPGGLLDNGDCYCDGVLCG